VLDALGVKFRTSLAESSKMAGARFVNIYLNDEDIRYLDNLNSRPRRRHAAIIPACRRLT